ncbi:hypothetical protein ACO0SA_004418 [Hanseniaspora valbyensis]
MCDNNDWFSDFNTNLSNNIFGDENGKVYNYSKNSRRLACYLAETNNITSRTLIDFNEIQQKNDKEFKEASFILDNVSSTNPTLTLPTTLLELKNNTKNNDNKNVDENSNEIDNLPAIQLDISDKAIIREKESVKTTTPPKSKADDMISKKTTPLNANKSTSSNLKEELLTLSLRKDSLQNNRSNSLKSAQKSNIDISSADHTSNGNNYTYKKNILSGLESTSGGQIFKSKSNRTSQYFKPLPARSINDNHNTNRPHLYTMKEETKTKSYLLETLESKNILPKKSFAEANKAHERISNVKESIRAGVNMPSLKMLPTIHKNSVNISATKNKLLEKKLSMAASIPNKAVTKVSSSQNVFDRLTSTGTKSSISKNNATRASANRVSPIRVNKSPMNLRERRADTTPKKIIEIRSRKTPIHSSERRNQINIKTTESSGPDLSFSTPKAGNSASNKKLSERKHQLLNISPLRNDFIYKKQLHKKQQNLQRSPKKISHEINKIHNIPKSDLNGIADLPSKQPLTDENLNVEKDKENNIATENINKSEPSNFKSPTKMNSVLYDIDFKDHRMRVDDTPPKGPDESLPEINSDSETEESPQKKVKKHLQPWATESSLLSLIRQQQRDRTKDPFKIFGPIDDVDKLDEMLK